MNNREALRTLRGLAFAAGILFAASPAIASKIWSSTLSGWTLHLDNGVAYVTASNMPSNCQYTRAKIPTNLTLSGSSTYARDIYAFVLASSAAGKPLQVVVETTETDCIVYGAKNE